MKSHTCTFYSCFFNSSQYKAALQTQTNKPTSHMSTATTTTATTYAETEAVRAFTITAAEALAASNLYWYFQNCASITADLALHCDLAPATVSSVVANIIENDSFPDRHALDGEEEFSKALRTAARAAILRMKEAAAARAAQEEAEELAQDLADEKAYQLKRRAELKERNAKRALHPTPAERAMPARATKRIAKAME